MNHEPKYGDVALGVEAALPPGRAPARRLLDWLLAALGRWA